MAARIARCLSFHGAFGRDDYKAYVDGLQEDTGTGTDPVQRMVVEQFAFVHLRLLHLQGEAGAAGSPEEMRINTTEIAQLLGEFRSLALTLDALRAKVHTPAKPALKIARIA